MSIRQSNWGVLEGLEHTGCDGSISFGYGDIVAVHRVTGISQNTIRVELKELESKADDLPPLERIVSI